MWDIFVRRQALLFSHAGLFYSLFYFFFLGILRKFSSDLFLANQETAGPDWKVVFSLNMRPFLVL